MAFLLFEVYTKLPDLLRTLNMLIAVLYRVTQVIEKEWVMRGGGMCGWDNTQYEDTGGLTIIY